MVRKYKVTETRHVVLYCDKCGKEMKRVGVRFVEDSCVNKYECECGHITEDSQCYPFQQISFDLEDYIEE